MVKVMHGFVGHEEPRCGRMFTIEPVPEAIDDLRLLRKLEQKQVVAAIESQLESQATRGDPKSKAVAPESTG